MRALTYVLALWASRNQMENLLMPDEGMLTKDSILLSKPWKETNDVSRSVSFTKANGG